jgi:two-component system, cell cycle sensor histidine kinase and response regulator CckA
MSVLRLTRSAGSVACDRDSPRPDAIGVLSGQQQMLKGTETILVVEDNDSMRRLVLEILRRGGYRTLAASNALEALEVCGSFVERIDLLLSDVTMPKMNGRELATRIRHLRSDMKILLMSGHSEETVLGQGEIEQGVAFIQKPITPRSLSDKVRQVLDGT